VCIVNIVGGIEIFSLSSEPAKIVATEAFNNLARNGISVVALPLATEREKL
jgi:hypothetical protein